MEITNINKKRIIELFKLGDRLDRRKLTDFREIYVESGISNKAEGSVRVKIGLTEVIVGVKMETQEPYPDHSDEGTMMVSMEFSPAAGERYEMGPPKIDAIEIARVVDRGIRESKFVDWKKLCIKEGEKVWSVLIDIYCINDDGNVLDASALGAVTALKIARMPVYDKKNEVVKFGELSDEPLPLTDSIPLTITFYKAGKELIIDPNREEEDSSESRLTLAISQPKKEKIINAMQKGNIISLTADDLDKIIELSESIHTKLFTKFQKLAES